MTRDERKHFAMVVPKKFTKVVSPIHFKQANRKLSLDKVNQGYHMNLV